MHVSEAIQVGIGAANRPEPQDLGLVAYGTDPVGLDAGQAQMMAVDE